MKDSVLNYAKQISYFHDSIAENDKERIYQIFSNTWAKLASYEKNKIKKYLDLIIIGPFTDPRNPNNPGATNLSPFHIDFLDPEYKTRINWMPNLSSDNFCKVLLHELGHVYFLHPQKGKYKTGKDLCLYMQMADSEVNKWMAKKGVI